MRKANEGELQGNLGAASDDSGGWGYNDVGSSALHGTVFVNCTHTDSKGSSWAAY